MKFDILETLKTMHCHYSAYYLNVIIVVVVVIIIDIIIISFSIPIIAINFFSSRINTVLKSWEKS